MNHYLYFIPILYLLFTKCSTDENPLSFLTRNDTQNWYRNLTKNMSPGNPYCSICCISTSRGALGKNCGKHTMCIYNEKRLGAACKGFLNIPFTDNEIDVIVDAHNTIRNKVAMGSENRGSPGPQPMASNMRAIEWDKELALVANRWAAQCIFTYDLCRDVGRFPVGQNIAKGNSAFNSDISFIIDWYNNVDYLSKDEIGFFQIKPSNALSQYTQLIWAETYRIGCARVAFQQAKGANVTYREHFICNYGPRGNIPGQPIYRIGEPCSSCTDGTSCTVEYPGLCGSEATFEITLERREIKKTVNDDDSGSDECIPRGSVILRFYCIIFIYCNIM